MPLDQHVKDTIENAVAAAYVLPSTADAPALTAAGKAYSAAVLQYYAVHAVSLMAPELSQTLKAKFPAMGL